MTLIGYARVSTADQNMDMQMSALLAAGIKAEDIYSDERSGKSRKKRDGLEAAMKRLQPGDTLIAWKLDRLGRSLRDLQNIIEELRERGVSVRFLQGDIQTDTATGKLFFHLLAAFAEFEREIIIERTKAGLESARANGSRLGRMPRVEYDVLDIEKRLRAGTVRGVANETGLSVGTVAKVRRGMAG